MTAAKLPRLASEAELAAAAATRRPIESEWAVANDSAAAEELRASLDQIAAERHYLVLLVAVVREAGWSWQRVGDAFGITRQAAMKQYASAGEELRKVTRNAEGNPQAMKELHRMYSSLGVGTQRITYEVRNVATGEGISRHFVEARAHESVARYVERTGEPAHVVKVTKRSKGGGVSTSCRKCGDEYCRCCGACGGIPGDAERPCKCPTSRPVIEVEGDDEEPF